MQNAKIVKIEKVVLPKGENAILLPPEGLGKTGLHFISEADMQNNQNQALRRFAVNAQQGKLKGFAVKETILSIPADQIAFRQQMQDSKVPVAEGYTEITAENALRLTSQFPNPVSKQDRKGKNWQRLDSALHSQATESTNDDLTSRLLEQAEREKHEYLMIDRVGYFIVISGDARTRDNSISNRLESAVLEVNQDNSENDRIIDSQSYKEKQEREVQKIPKNGIAMHKVSVEDVAPEIGELGSNAEYVSFSEEIPDQPDTVQYDASVSVVMEGTSLAAQLNEIRMLQLAEEQERIKEEEEEKSEENNRTKSVHEEDSWEHEFGGWYDDEDEE